MKFALDKVEDKVLGFNDEELMQSLLSETVVRITVKDAYKRLGYSHPERVYGTKTRRYRRVLVCNDRQEVTIVEKNESGEFDEWISRQLTATSLVHDPIYKCEEGFTTTKTGTPATILEAEMSLGIDGKIVWIGEYPSKKILCMAPRGLITYGYMIFRNKTRSALESIYRNRARKMFGL